MAYYDTKEEWSRQHIQRYFIEREKRSQNEGDDMLVSILSLPKTEKDGGRMNKHVENEKRVPGESGKR